jgi:hypothetical protein
VFPAWSVLRYYKQGTRLELVQFCSVVREERASARQSSLLEVVARERLVMTQQTGEVLAGAVVICELWRSAVAL